jgi:uncharacterized protein with von Willebrand factor type A (vWA) domain
MMMVNTLQALLGREASERVFEPDLPKSVVTHTSLDDLALGNLLEDSVRFREVTSEAPKVPADVPEPDPIDITTASREEIAAYQEQSRAARAAKEEAAEYGGWGDLRDDMFRMLHTHDAPELEDEVDASRELNKRIMAKFHPLDEIAEMRNITRDDPTAAGIGTMALTRRLRETCEESLVEQMRESDELEKARKEAEEHEIEIENIVPGGIPGPEGEGGQPQGTTATAGGEGGGTPAPVKLSQKAKEQLAELESKRDAARERAEELANHPTPMGRDALEGIEDAAKAGQEAAEAAKGVPRFGAGIGKGEPTYTSPEQALSIAERWANDPDLRAMAELFGRLDKDIRFKRSKRVVGGNDEIVDVRLGDDLRRTLPNELSQLAAGGAAADDFYSRFVSKEVMEYQTVGEEHAGRGPILMVLDGSGSMHGDRNVWARAVAMCLLHIARLERRDFALVEFSGGHQTEEWHFKATDPMPGQRVLDMASHFFGGGTVPLLGIERAKKIMAEAPAFNKADIVLVGDGESGFGPEDERLRSELTSMGVRIFGICVGGSWDYITKYCEPDGHVVDVHDFNLQDPSAATAELATHIT